MTSLTKTNDMSIQQTKPEAQTATQTQPTDFQRLLEKPNERTMDFVPFGATDKIKLSVPVVQKLLAIRTRSGATCSDRDAMRFMMMCQAQRLNPFAGDAFLTGYDSKNGPMFSLITAHVALLKRAETCEDYEGMESGVILMQEDGKTSDREGDFAMADEQVVGGWAVVYRKGRKPTRRRLSIDAMQPNYETPFWSKQKAPGQVVKCAEADALRSTFPTLLGGLYTGEQIGDRMGSNVAVELPANGLVEVRGAPHSTDSVEGQEESEPVRKRKEPDAPAIDLAQTALQNLILEAGHDFATLQKFGEASGSWPEASSCPDFASVPTAVAERLFRLFKGKSRALMLQQMEELKGQLV